MAYQTRSRVFARRSEPVTPHSRGVCWRSRRDSRNQTCRLCKANLENVMRFLPPDDPHGSGLVRSNQGDRTRGRTRRFLLGETVVAIFGLLLTVSKLAGAQPTVTESQVQAAYLYNFGRFVQFPASAASGTSDSFKICVVGDDPF